MRVGICEEDERLRAQLAEALADAGFAVRAVPAGEPASAPSVLVLDGDARELLARLGVPGSGEGMRLDPAAHGVRAGERLELLTPTEFRLLEALTARVGACVRRRELVSAAWPEGTVVHDNTLDAYMVRVRRKLARLGAGARISTMRGVGYTLWLS